MNEHAAWTPAPGELVRMAYKSGIYIGEVVETNGPRAVRSEERRVGKECRL